MSYIFIDESGDLGTKESSSNYFVIAGIKVDDYKKLDRIISKTRRNSKNNIGFANEIKGTNTPEYIKRNILKSLNKIEYESFFIIFNKIYRYKIDFNYDNNFLYDILVSQLANLINIDDPTFVFMDKYKNKIEENNKLNSKFLYNLNNFKNYPIVINNVNSFSFKGIQIADLLSWSAFQCVEYKNSEYLSLIKNKTIKRVFED